VSTGISGRFNYAIFDMSKSKKDVSGVRVHSVATISASDIERARALPKNSCPRRYCWWWHTLAFDWEVAPQDGCTFLNSEKPPGWPNETSPCKRCDASSQADHFEPREPHLIEDGMVPEWYWRWDGRLGS